MLHVNSTKKQGDDGNINGSSSNFMYSKTILLQDQEIEFSNLLKLRGENLSKLLSGEPSNIRDAALYFSRILSFHQTHPSLSTNELLSHLCNSLLIVDDIMTCNYLVQGILHFIEVMGSKLDTDFCNYILQQILSISPPINECLAEYLTCLFLILKLAIVYLEISLTPGFVEHIVGLLGIHPHLDISICKFMVKAYKYRYNDLLNELTISFARCAISSPFAKDSVFYIAKCLGKCICSVDDFFENNPDILLHFKGFWGIDSDTDSILFSLAGLSISVQLLIEFIDPDGYVALIKAINNDDAKIKSSAFSLLGILIEFGWPCPFPMKDVLDVAINYVYSGSLKSRWMSGKFLGSVAIANPDFFYDNFLEPIEDDSDEEPNHSNYARAFGIILQLPENIAMATVMDGLYSIGKLFAAKDQMHEFKETLDLFEISACAESLSSSSDEYIQSSAEMLYSTFVTFIFSTN